jgi:hypothetical protein
VSPKDRSREERPDRDVRIRITRSSTHPVEYAVVLLARREGRWHTVHVFDNSHDPEESTRAALANEDLGYPDEVSFLPGDQAWADEAAWELLHAERKAVVVVTAEHEILMIPRRHNSVLHWIDGVRGSTPVLVQWRAHGRDREPYAIATHVGRHPLGRMRELAHAA